MGTDSVGPVVAAVAVARAAVVGCNAEVVTLAPLSQNNLRVWTVAEAKCGVDLQTVAPADEQVMVVPEFEPEGLGHWRHFG